jgi:hypothetical protein
MGITDDLFGPQEPEVPDNPDPKTDELTEEPQAANPDEPEEPEGKNAYTPEEMKALDFEKIDTTRIPEEMQPFYKAMQASFTKKQMSLSDRIKAIEEKQSTPEKVDSQPGKTKTIEDYFNDDPESTLSYIDQQILDKLNEADRLEDEGNDREARKANRIATEWSSVKSSLVARRQSRIEAQNKVEREIQKTLMSFPDYDQKKDALVDFIVEQSPEFTKKEAEDLIDATKGMKNVKLAKLLAKFSDQAQAPITGKEKLIKKTPEELGRPGSSKASSTKGKEPEFDYAKEFEIARNSGDFTRVLQFKGAI